MKQRQWILLHSFHFFQFNGNTIHLPIHLPVHSKASNNDNDIKILALARGFDMRPPRLQLEG